MNKQVNERLYRELEMFVTVRLKGLQLQDQQEIECLSSSECRLKRTNEIWKEGAKDRREITRFPQLTNHEICHEMFWNAYRGYSKMYIQMPNLNSEENTFTNYLDISADGLKKRENEENTITLSCTLLTLQMLDYDTMMFNAMESEDGVYREAAINHYRPYLFSYVTEIDQKQFERLQEIQKQQEQQEDEKSYRWLSCTFNTDAEQSLFDLKGYVVESASDINKIKMDLRIIEDPGTSAKEKKNILDNYKLRRGCEPDCCFTEKLKSQLDRLTSIYVYRIGNGNCIYAESSNKEAHFFFDIGFNYRHRPKRLSSKLPYNYSSAMEKIRKKEPSSIILSHWDMDHIAGSFVTRKDFFEKKWFAPDCHDACLDAKRLAKYLDMKGNLFRVARKIPGQKTGRMIGEILIGNGATSYKIFMGEKASCDGSYPNCEGIVIKYESANKTVMMMGDVNYESFNKAITNYNARSKSTGSAVASEPLFEDTQIDYLIVPHHGSEHTAYCLIVGNPLKPGKKAVICCTDEPCDNRPNDSHRKKLKKRFPIVSTTGSDAKGLDYIKIKPL